MNSRPDGINIYGGSAGLRIERIQNKQQEWVLSIDAAKCTGGTTGNGLNYDWDNKVVFQILPREMTAFTACLLGIVPSFNASLHGPSKDKRMYLVCQPEKGGYYLRLQQKDLNLSVPISQDKVFSLASLSLKVLSEQCFSDQATTLVLLRATSGRLLNQVLQKADHP